MRILKSDLRFPSDSLLVRAGFDGHEPIEIEERWKRRAVGHERIVVSINTYYEELQGGFYINRSLFQFITDCLDEVGIKLVWSELDRNDGIVPVELGYGLEFNEEYRLLSSMSQCVGELLIWHMTTGGGGEFYSDNIIFDFLAENSTCFTINSKLASSAALRPVKFTQLPAGQSKPLEKTGILRRLLGNGYSK